jgi:hypothetical protein
MLNRDMFRWMKSLSDDQNFNTCIALSDRALDEQYDMELVLRFLTFRKIPQADLTGLRDLGEFLTENVRRLARDKTFNKKFEEDAFRTTFKLLAEVVGDDSFRRYDNIKKRFSGGFSISAFEVVALGVGYNYKKISTKPGILLDKVKAVWSNPEIIDNSGAGINAPNRIRKIVPVGRKVFAI